MLNKYNYYISKAETRPNLADEYYLMLMVHAGEIFCSGIYLVPQRQPRAALNTEQGSIFEDNEQATGTFGKKDEY